MISKVIGFALFAGKDGRNAIGEPLSYGREDEPNAHMLLKRGRVHIFKTSDEAMLLLDKSLDEEDKIGSKWHKKASFHLVLVEAD